MIFFYLTELSVICGVSNSMGAKQFVYNVVEIADSQNNISRYVDIFIINLIFLNVMAVILETVGSFIAMLGVGMVALPAGILGSGFMEMIQRKREEKTCPHCGKSLHDKEDRETV